MKDSCGVDMGETSEDPSRILVTTISLDHAHHRVKPKLLNMMNSMHVVVVIVVLMSVVVLVDRYRQMERIGQLERKQKHQEALIREIQEDLRSLTGGPPATYVPTEAEKQPQKMVSLKERQFVTRRHHVKEEGEREGGNPINSEKGADVKRDEYLKRFKRPAADPSPSSEGSNEGNTTRQKRRVSKKDKRKKKCRQENGSCDTPTCEFVNQCHEARHGGRNHCNHFVAHFEQPNSSNQLIDDVIGNWEHASWLGYEPTRKLRIKASLADFPERPRRSTIEVRETGIYYIYSQVTFADESSYLGHSILIDNNITFTCSLWVNDVEANTCTTGGLVKIEAHQLVHIQLIESNRVINMDKANTFFGIIHYMSLP